MKTKTLQESFPYKLDDPAGRHKAILYGSEAEALRASGGPLDEATRGWPFGQRQSLADHGELHPAG